MRQLWGWILPWWLCSLWILPPREGEAEKQNTLNWNIQNTRQLYKFYIFHGCLSVQNSSARQFYQSCCSWDCVRKKVTELTLVAWREAPEVGGGKLNSLPVPEKYIPSRGQYILYANIFIEYKYCQYIDIDIGSIQRGSINISYQCANIFIEYINIANILILKLVACK